MLAQFCEAAQLLNPSARQARNMRVAVAQSSSQQNWQTNKQCGWWQQDTTTVSTHHDVHMSQNSCNNTTKPQAFALVYE